MNSNSISRSSYHQAEFEQMTNTSSQRDGVIARFMQQAESKVSDGNNPFWSNNQKKEKGKGHRISFQDQVPKSSNPSSSGRSMKPTTNPRASQTRPVSPVKQNLIQMLMCDAPPDFKYTKEELYIHIQLLWGMLTPAALPKPPDKHLLKEFYQQFSSVEEIQSVAQKSQGVKLINEAQFQNLHAACSRKRKVGKNIINMQDFYITYVHATLAKLGICIWAPNQEEAPDSLYNGACHIVALMTFQQIACSAAYQYM
ncbi:hypothetical protein O181_077583 [Austropuccinia psidii MF-1]|uniref:Uncharacterized protein n=1 Tax=Austropuccinia psidii MF-1 TaxID=1389203 RepID=A0A9Q3FH83_9BASI|nr:hypothetical protein [Austropuccinia psidii MF-1]